MQSRITARRGLSTPRSQFIRRRSQTAATVFAEDRTPEVIVALLEVGNDEGGSSFVQPDGGIPSCSHADSFVTRAAARRDVERRIADNENVFGLDRIAVLTAGC